MEGNELNVFAQTHPLESEKEDGETISRHNKSGFRHFVEESTLRNVSLDELEELSDSGCASGTDGNIRRTPSTVSSEQPVRFAVIVEWRTSYLKSVEAFLRLALLICCSISLACATGAGNNNADVLDMQVASCVRAHIFSTVLAILITATFFILGVTSLIKSFPLYWNVIDAALHGSLTILLLFTSAILFHAVDMIHDEGPPITDWTKVLLSLAAGFGCMGTMESLFISVTRACARTVITEVSDDIVLTSLRTS